MVETLPSPVGGACLIPGRELRSHLPPGPKKKKNINNRSNVVTNSTKTLKMIHIKKNIFNSMQFVLYRFAIFVYSTFVGIVLYK